MYKTYVALVCLILLVLSMGIAYSAVETVSTTEAQAWERYLVPLPKTINITSKVTVNPASVAIIAPESTDVVIPQACKELRKTLGLAENAANPANPAFTITLVLGGSEADSLSSLKNSDQASKITIEPGNTGLRLIALDGQGLYYAAKSLQQLIAPYVTATSATIPLLEMTDWPDMADRGLWGCDHFLWLKWMGDRKMNIGEQISARSVTSDGVGHSSLKDGREPMVTEGPYYCVKPVPATLHLEQVSGSGLFAYYPQVIGVGGQYGCICYSNGAFTHVLADWICDLASLPFVNDVDVWMAENLHGQGGCQCSACSLWNRNVLEAKTIVAAWQEAKTRLGRNIGLRILTSEETESSNADVFAVLPSDVKVWYYHSLYTYISGRCDVISTAVKNLAASGRYAGVCPSLSSIGCTEPFQSADFVNYRMKEFVSKNIKGLLGYATPPPLVNFCGYNVEAAAEWSWNSSGRSTHEFAASYAVRKGMKDPELFADWTDTIGKLELDVYGSDWPTGEGKYIPGYVANSLLNGSLPGLASTYPGYRGPFGEFTTTKQFDDDVALAAKAMSIAKEMGINEYYYESVYVDGLINALRSLYKLKGLVVGGTVSATNRETARYYFGVYVNSLKQSIDAVQNWCKVVNNETSSVTTVVNILQHCINGESGTSNPGMLSVAATVGCTPTLAYTGEPAVTIADAKTKGAGASAKLYGDLVTGSSGTTFYIQEPDRTAAIKVISSTTPSTTTSAPAMVLGTVTNIDGELVVNADTVQSVGSAQTIAPVATAIRSIAGGEFGGQPALMEYRLIKENNVWVRRLLPTYGLNNLGLFVRVTGKVTYVGTDYIYIDDGSKCDDDSGHYGIRVYCGDPSWSKPNVGEHLIINGMCSSYLERGYTWRALYVPTITGITTDTMPLEIILDEDVATTTGTWNYINSVSGAYKRDYKYAAASTTEDATATWTPNITRAGGYDVYVMYNEGADRTTNAAYTIYYNGGSETYHIDQTTGGGVWQKLGTKTFAAGTGGYVTLSNATPAMKGMHALNTATADTGKVVVADAVRFVYAGEGGENPPTITGNPSNQSVCPGTSATFTAIATGSGTLLYQWYKGTTIINNGGHYSGADTSTLVVSSCDSSDIAANYNCVVTNNYGIATSNDAVLSLISAPSAPPVLDASGIGTDTITWNWGTVPGATGYTVWDAASGGNQISGAITNNSYTETGLDPAVAYTRYVEAIGQCSNSATRTLLGPTSTAPRYCVENGNFEEGFTGNIGNHWKKLSGSGTFEVSTSKVYDGQYSQKITDVVGGDPYTAPIYQKINVQPNHGYILKVNHMRDVTSGAMCGIDIDSNGGFTPNFSYESTGTAGVWKLKTPSFTSGTTGVVNIMLSAGYNAGNGTIYIDGVYLLPQAPISSGSTTITNGSSATITASGGFGGTDSELRWYTGPAGTGTYAGSGKSLVVKPTATTKYYPRWEPAPGCPSDDGAVVTVTVL